MVSIGACLAFDPQETFYAKIKPLNDNQVPLALSVSGLDWEQLKREGLAPEDAMAQFADWIEQVTPPGSKPVFVAFNAPFDWMFVADYFYRFLGQNPFGHQALDIKAYYMGLHGVSWQETAMRFVADRYLEGQKLSHNALDDAMMQAQIFRIMLDEARK